MVRERLLRQKRQAEAFKSGAAFKVKIIYFSALLAASIVVFILSSPHSFLIFSAWRFCPSLRAITEESGGGNTQPPPRRTESASQR